MMFTDRREAGVKLGERLLKYKGKDCVVYAIPRGGVILGDEVARVVRAPLDLIITRKVGHPYNPEFAVCVVTESGERICDEPELEGIDKKWLEIEVSKERQEAKRRRELYLEGRDPLVAETAILVDDGVATGLTYLMAIKELRQRKVKRIVAAVPVMPREFLPRLKEVVDEVVCLNIDEAFRGAVGSYYEYFPQVSDDEVKQVMSRY